VAKHLITGKECDNGTEILYFDFDGWSVAPNTVTWPFWTEISN